MVETQLEVSGHNSAPLAVATSSFERSLPSLTTFWLLFKQGIGCEWVEKERLISPLFFALTLIIMFSFAFDRMDPSAVSYYFTAELYLTIVLTVQIALIRAFSPEVEDGAFDLIRTYGFNKSWWYCAKFCQMLVVSLLVCLPSVILLILIHGSYGMEIHLGQILGILFLALVGLNGLGVLLVLMTLRSHGKEILMPLLFYPLTLPVLLCSVQATQLVTGLGEPSQQNVFASQLRSWLGLLLGFDIIYLTLGFLLFEDVIASQ